MRTSDIFAQPSIRELGAGVVIEAMACGLPCVVVDYGGPAELIDDDRGIKVQLAPFDQLKLDFGTALARLASNDEALSRMGDAARLHAKRFYTWEVKAQKMIEVYKWVLGQGERPNFWAPMTNSSKSKRRSPLNLFGSLGLDDDDDRGARSRHSN